MLATQNPIEYEGTYPLPEAQLDRFLLRMSVGYPTPRRRVAGARRSRAERGHDEVELEPVLDTRDAARAAAGRRDASTSRRRSACTWSTSSPRPASSQSIQVGASPRGSLALLKLSRCRAALAGRDYVTPDDVKAVAVPALAHRLTLRPELWVQRISAEDIVARAARLGPDAGRRGSRPDVIRQASPKLAAYAALSAAGLLGALVAGRPELVALTAPFLLALGLGLALPAPPRITASLELDRRAGDRGRRSTRATRARVGDHRRSARRLRPAARRRRIAGEPNPVSIRLRAGERREVELPLEAYRYGGHVLGPTFLRARDSLGFLAWEAALATTAAAARLPARRRAAAGAPPARDAGVRRQRDVAAKGEGIEFADLRQFAPGDPLKRVNWRASARRGELWVNESHPERNTDVILFVDSFAEARLGGESTLDLAVRATAVLADAYARRRDRVGLVGYGGILRWLTPGTGSMQLHRIIDALLDTRSCCRTTGRRST